MLIDVATRADIADIILSAEALVVADAGRYDPGATNLDWAQGSGLSYATSLLAGDDNLVLVARDGDAVVGHLVARVHGPGSVHPIRVAELESIHVYPDHRGRGIGHKLMGRFLAWGTAKAAHRFSVTAYAGNEGAHRFYARYGFAPRSVILDRDVA